MTLSRLISGTSRNDRNPAFHMGRVVGNEHASSSSALGEIAIPFFKNTIFSEMVPTSGYSISGLRSGTIGPEM